MPNWCYNQTIFYGDENQLEKLKADFKDALSNGPKKFKAIENSWGNLWLGNIFLEAGYSEADFENKKICCRGGIVDFDFEHSEFIRLGYETAWIPIISSLEIMLEEKYPGLKQVTIAEEPGCGIYINTDVEGLYFKDKFLIEYCFLNNDGTEECDTNYFQDEERFLEAFNEISKKVFKGYKKICKTYNEANEIIRDFSDSLEDGCYLIVEKFFSR